jgi:hypothetical protein
MFGAEPQEEWNERDVADFERHASVCLHRCIIAVIRAAVLLLASALCLLPFMAGHYLNKYWYAARVLVWVTLAAFLWFFYKVMLIWASWQSSRETRREFGDHR